MFTHWKEILPSTIVELSPLHRDIIMYIMSLPGKRRISYGHAKRTWNLDRSAFDAELAQAFRLVRQQMHRYGITGSGDLDFA